MTTRKFCSPTQLAGCTRFVCCSDMTTVRTIGYHENAPKTNRSGNRKTTVDSPPPLTHVSGVRRERRRSEAPVTADVASTSPNRPPALRAAPVSQRRPQQLFLRAARDCALRDAVRLTEQRLHVRI